jgi:hypothetical protein
LKGCRGLWYVLIAYTYWWCLTWFRTRARLCWC